MCDYLEGIKVLSPVGVWEVQFCKSGLHWVKLEKGQSQDIDLNVKVEVTGGRDSNHPFVKWLSVYFESIWSLKSISLPVVVGSGRKFGRKSIKSWGLEKLQPMVRLLLGVGLMELVKLLELQ